jgi:hypothetical protein
MTATGTPRHEGSTGRRGLALPWANRFKSGLLDIPPYRSIYIYYELRTNVCRWSRHNDKDGTYRRRRPYPGYIWRFVEVFSKAKAETLPQHRSTDHAIDLEPGYNLPYGQIYNLSEFELRTLKAYISANLANGFVQRSSWPAAPPILFAKMKDGGLRLCVDYRALNTATVKKQYSLPLISEMLDCVREARIFTKLDFRGAYNLIRIKKGDEYKTAFRMCYGQFEYQVMPFGLSNVPATFQSYIDDCLPPYIDDFAVCYLDDILICLANEKEQEDHVRQVLQRLKEFGLNCKAEKCQFGVSRVGFLRFVITPNGVGMESDRISTIDDWPTSK